MDELLEQFLIEGPELVQRAGADLLDLERRPGDADLVDSAFRAIHTLKGSVGLFDLPQMEAVLHAAEDLLSEVRSGAVVLSSDLIDGLLGAVDLTDAWLGDLARRGRLSDDAEERAGAVRTRLLALGGAQTEDATETADEVWARALLQRHGPAGVAIRYRPDPDAYFRGDDPLAIARGLPGLVALEVELAPADPSDAYDAYRCRLVFLMLSSAGGEAVGAALRLVRDQVQVVERLGAGGETEKRAPSQSIPAPASAASTTGATLRIDPRRVDALADLADELIAAKTALLAVGEDAAALRRSQDEVGRLANAIHRGIMRLRLSPLSPTLRRVERQARDLAATLGKAVDLDIRGHALEADRSVIDALQEPLVHLLRNALDHGAETPEARRAAGKPERARIAVAGRVEGDDLVIVVTDDGPGLDPARLRAHALARGLLAAGDAEIMSDAESLDLIFLPGFSTASEVTAISGRGVGMDAVRAALAQHGGKLGVASTPGAGAAFTIRMPLAAVLTRALLVESGGEVFAAPMLAIQETFTLARADVVALRHGQAFTRADRVLPLLFLDDRLGLPPAERGEHMTVLRVNTADGESAGLVVDRIVDRLDLVVRPLAGLLAAAPNFTGTSVLGDGGLLLVLDLAEIVA